jgi:hypothetical protein
LAVNFGQASPSDLENFPFVVLGNKVDVDSGNSRVVSPVSAELFCVYFRFELFRKGNNLEIALF